MAIQYTSSVPPIPYSDDNTVSPAPYHGSPFGGFRVAADLVVRDNTHLYPGPATAYDPDVYGFDVDVGNKGTATHLPDKSAIQMAVTDGTNGAKARLRTHDQVRYQAGAATLIEITGFQSDTGKAGQARRLGIFDDSDGVFFETAGSRNRIVVRTSTSGTPVDNVIDQADWNVYTYPSLDVSKANRYRFVLAWLGVEGIQCFINGILVHVFHFANVLTAPYIKTATLPISVEVVNLTDSSAGAITYICSTARILNGGDYATYGFGFSVQKAGVGTTMIPAFSLRIASTFNGISSRVQALPVLLSLFSETNSTGMSVVWNPTLTGATYAAASPSNAVQIDTAASAMSGGTTLFYAGLATNSTQNWDMGALFNLTGKKLRRQAFTGTSDVVTIGVMREGAANSDPRVSLTWKELR